MPKTNKWKTEFFRPEILDATKELRKNYFAVLEASELSRVAFNRKMFEAGLAFMKSKYVTNNNKSEF